MKLIAQTKIGPKIILMIMAMAVVAGAIAVYAAIRLKSLDNDYNALIDKQTGAAFALATANRAAVSVGYGTYMVVSQDMTSEQSQKGRAMRDEDAAEVERLLTTAAQLVPDKVVKIEALRDHFRRVKQLSDAALELGLQGVKAQALEAEATADTAISDYVAAGIGLRKELVTDVDNRSTALSERNTRDSLIMVTGALVAATFMVIAGLLMSAKTITGPLNQLAERMRRLASGDLEVVVEGQDRGDEVGVMARAVQVFKANGLKALDVAADADRMRTEADRERLGAEAARQRTEAEQAMVVKVLADSLGQLAKGDLTAQIDAPFEGQYAQIRSDFNAAIGSLRETMANIANATGAIRGGSDEIASASDDLSRRTEQQAASLEETAAALDEITATVRRSADGAKKAASAASSAKVDAQTSGSVMREAVSAMTEIEQSSGQITNIIGVIDEIAFQTNLLALNAGVEAARAGDAGKGFAVVAQEVRALAQRSAEAAREIKALIASSSTQVERGVKLVGDTGQALSKIVGKVAEIDVLISEIAQSAQEQATGLNQVNVAVNQMDQVTQQNAAMVEQATAASSNLRTEAGGLADMVSRFKIGADTRGRNQPLAARLGPPSSVHSLASARAKIVASAGDRGRAAGAEGGWEEF